MKLLFPGENKHSLKSLAYLKQFLIAILLLILVTIIGTVGFVLIEDYSLIEAFYMTIITLSTVGFTEVRELSDNGRMFTSLLIIFNIAVFTYSISILSRFILEGDFRKLIMERTMKNEINKIKNHAIICGHGRYGSEIAKRYIKFNEAFVVIDSAHDIIEKLRTDVDIKHIEGDATKDDILIEAGIKRASVLFTTLPADADNVYVILTAKQINPKLKIIARGTDPKAENKLIRAGANHVVMPEQIGGFYMTSLVRKPDAVEFFNIMTEQDEFGVSFEEIILHDLPEKLQNKTLKEINARDKTGANIVCLKSPLGKYIINPSLNTKLEANIGIFVMGTEKQIKDFESFIED